MKIKNKKDFGLGVFCILFAALIIYLSLQLKGSGYDGDPGPKMFLINRAVSADSIDILTDGALVLFALYSGRGIYLDIALVTATLGSIGSVIMAVCGIALIIAPEKEQKVFLTKTQWKAAFGLFGMYVALALLLWLLGFMFAVPIVLFIVTFMLSKLSVKNATVKHRLIISLIFGVVGGAVLYLAYIVGLKAQMPTGLLIELLKKK